MTNKPTLLRTLAGAAVLSASLASAQTTFLQVIHNCADPAAALVDVYVNGDLALDNFAFRTATEFLEVPAGVELSIAIARETSTSVDDAIFTQAFTLDESRNYILVASGVTSVDGFEPTQEFALNAFDAARLVADGTGVDLLVVHGATDAPTVDVFESAVLGGTAVNDLSYSEIAGYLTVPADDYQFEIQLSDGTPTGLGYLAPLATLGLEGEALTVLASGFLNPAVNSNGPAFGLWVARAGGGSLLELPAVQVATGSARVQVIHNSADAAAAVVDVYINDELAIPDLAFRNATPFVELPSGLDLVVGIAPGDSENAGDIIAQFTYNLEADGRYIIVANGIVSPSGYDPATPFNLDVFGGARSNSLVAFNTDVLVYHGSTDAPTVNVAETSIPAGTVVSEISYSEFQGYLELPAADYELEVQTTDGTPVVRYSAPLETLSLDGLAITVLASGFLNPANNSDGAAFGLWVALPEGGPLVELPVITEDPTARIQVIHNCADAAAAIVDIYINGDLALEDVPFRSATEFLSIPAEVELVFGIAPGNSTSAADVIAEFPFTLENERTYIVVANGIVSPTGYSPAPAFNLDVFAQGREEATVATNTDVLVMHGSTDAPVVDVAEILVPAGTVVNDLAYGSFAGYLELGTANYALQVQTADGTPVVTYDAPLAGLGLEGQAITVLASGFLDPSNNSNGPAFGLYVALAGGGDLVPLPVITNVGVNSLADDALTVSAWPNPANDVLNVSIDARELRQVSATITDMTGRVVVQVPASVINVGENRLQIGTAQLSEGLYSLSLIGNEGITTIPVQVMR